MAEKKVTARKAKKVPRAKKVIHVPPEQHIPIPNELNVYNLDGKVERSVELPQVFSSEFRPDLIKRAVIAFRANRRQAYGPSPKSGMRHSVRWSGKGQGVSRVPRIRGTMIGAQAPGTKSGRRAHPPTPQKIWAQKINVKERKKARNAALAAICDPNRVRKRGHIFDAKITLPIIVVDDIEKTDTTTKALEVLKALKVIDDMERSRERKTLRAGRGKMRGRMFRMRRSLLLVVNNTSRVRRGFGNLPGIDITTPAGLNAEALAPGGDPGRLTAFSEGAFAKIRSW